jgi:glycosyltransferase involved in cell wall biosynthesis
MDLNAIPKVSVIVPTHNRPETLPRALCSVLNQSYRDIEVIVVDDASRSDAAREVTENLAKADTRLRYIRRSQCGGAAAARNTGIAGARGQFLAFQDDDDEWLPGKLQNQVELMERLGPRCVLAGGGLLRFVPETPPKLYSWPVSADMPWVDRRSFIEGFAAFLQTALIRRSAIDMAGCLNSDLATAEDYEWCLRLLEHGDFATLPAAVTRAYEQASSLSTSGQLRQLSITRVLSLHADLFRQYPKARAAGHYDIAVYMLRSGQRLKATRHWMTAFVSDPMVMRIYLLFPMLFFGATALDFSVAMQQRIKNRVKSS